MADESRLHRLAVLIDADNTSPRIAAGLSSRIKLKRVYEPASRTDGTRILVDRLWPRGLSKEGAAIEPLVQGTGAQHGAPSMVRS